MRYLAILSILFLNSCTTTSTVVIVAPGYDKVTEQTSFNFIDNRPDEEKSGGRIFLYSPVDRIDDKNLSAPTIEIFKTKIENRFGQKLAGSTITVDHLEVLNSFPKSANSDLAASMAALSYIAALLIDARTDKLEDSVICHLEGRLNDKAFKLAVQKLYYPEKMLIWSVFESDNFKSTLSTVINQCVNEGVMKIQDLCECDNA